MRKVYSLLVAAVLSAALATPAAAQDGPKLAFINSERIIAEAPGAQQARQSFEQEMQGYQAELQQLQEQIQQMISDYEQKQSTLSAEARQRQEEAIRQKQREFQQRAQQLEQQAAQRQSELVQPVMNQINTVIDDIRREGGYAFIFDAAAGGIITADPALDLTEQVLARLNSSAQN